MLRLEDHLTLATAYVDAVRSENGLPAREPTKSKRGFWAFLIRRARPA